MTTDNVALQGEASPRPAGRLDSKVIVELETARLLEEDKSWFEERQPMVMDRVRSRLAQLSASLGSNDWLEGDFSAGDLMMISALLRLRSSGVLDEFPSLGAYVERGEARGAYKRAFAAQLAVNRPESSDIG